jgi:hypothetical protein
MADRVLNRLDAGEQTQASYLHSAQRTNLQGRPTRMANSIGMVCARKGSCKTNVSTVTILGAITLRSVLNWLIDAQVTIDAYCQILQTRDETLDLKDKKPSTNNNRKREGHTKIIVSSAD